MSCIQNSDWELGFLKNYPTPVQLEKERKEDRKKGRQKEARID